jgi:type VI protein secretion system component Hcp
MAADSYMKLWDGDVNVEGETTDEEFKGKKFFEISSFDWTIAPPDKDSSDDGPSKTAKAGADGKAVKKKDKDVQDFQIHKAIDVASLHLFQACMKKTVFDHAVIIIRETGEMVPGKGRSLTPYLKFHFGKVSIKQFVWALTPGDTSDDSKEEQITFEFGQVAIEYIRQTKTGAHGKPLKWASWNLWKHKVWDEFSPVH